MYRQLLMYFAQGDHKLHIYDIYKQLCPIHLHLRDICVEERKLKKLREAKQHKRRGRGLAESIQAGPENATRVPRGVPRILPGGMHIFG
jgi:hypothetical protein